MAYEFIDLFWLSKLGLRAVGIATLAWSIAWVGFTLVEGYTLALIPYINSRDTNKGVSIIYWYGLIGVFTVSALIALTVYLIPLDKEVKSFSLIAILSVLPFYTFSFYRNLKAVRGDSNYLKISLISVILNLIIEPVLIFKLGFGVIGAAISNLISSALLGVLSFAYLRDEVRTSVLNLRRGTFIIRRYLKLALSLIGSTLSEGIGGTLFTYAMGLFSINLVGLWGAAELIVGVAWAFTSSIRDVLSSTISKLQSRELMYHRIRDSWLTMSLIGTSLTLLGALLLPDILLDNPSEVSALRQLLIVLGLLYPVSAVSLTGTGALRGLGEVQRGLVIDAFKEVISRPAFMVLSWLLLRAAHLPSSELALNALTYSLIISELLSSILSFKLTQSSLRLMGLSKASSNIVSTSRSLIKMFLNFKVFKLKPIRVVGGAVG